MSLLKMTAMFGFMVVAGYLLVVAFLPPPTDARWKPDDASGSSAAARLSQQAQALAARRPESSVQ